MRTPLLVIAAALVGLTSGCGQSSAQGAPTTTVPLTVVPATPTTTRAPTTTLSIAARAQATTQLCAAIAVADAYTNGRRIEDGGTGLGPAIAETEKVADPAVVSVARTMLTTAAARDVTGYSNAATDANDACTRAGHPTRPPQRLGPVQCIKAPCP